MSIFNSISIKDENISHFKIRGLYQNDKKNCKANAIVKFGQGWKTPPFMLPISG